MVAVGPQATDSRRVVMFPESRHISRTGLTPAEFSDDLAELGNNLVRAKLARRTKDKIISPPGLGPDIDFMDVGGKSYVSALRLAFPSKPELFTHEVEIMLPGGRTKRQNTVIFRRFYYGANGNAQGSRMQHFGYIDSDNQWIDAFFKDMVSEIEFNSSSV